MFKVGGRAPVRVAFMAALGTSALVHVVVILLILLALRDVRLRMMLADTKAAAPAWLLALAEPVELDAVELGPEIAVVSEAEALPEEWLSRPGDQDIRQLETSPRVAFGADPRPPAPDEGAGAGEFRPDSWRRDRQTLRAELTDASKAYRLARTRQKQAVASPQAERREPNVGIGDAPSSSRSALVLRQQQPLQSEGDEVVVARERASLEQRQGSKAQPGTGALFAEAGERRFDAERRGEAADVVDQRSASNERRPAVIDLAAAGSPGDVGVHSHKGPSDAPGAVAKPSPGVAASQYGAPIRVASGNQVALSTREVQRSRYEREIKRRAQSMLRFPRKLALELKQGETIVRFTVGPDGSLQGAVTVSKSAGFAEFDAEAMGAVRRAAPFPPMPEALTIFMRVAFENPVLR